MVSEAQLATRSSPVRARALVVPLAYRRVKLLDDAGLGLRLAGRFVRVACRFEARIRVYHRGLVADGKSLPDLLTLGAGRGSRFGLEACGPDAEPAVAALAALIAASSRGDGGPRVGGITSRRRDGRQVSHPPWPARAGARPPSPRPHSGGAIGGSAGRTTPQGTSLVSG